MQSQFFTGISYVQLRKSVPAVKSFQKIVTAIDEGVEGVEDESRMRDLAYLSMARTYYSASVRLDDNNAPTIDANKLSAAVKYWNRVDVASEYWLDALFEESWAYFMAGDYPHALGNIHTIESPYFPNSFYPEADILKAVISFTICQYEDATTIVARMKKKYEPIKKELEAVLNRFKGEGGEQKFFEFLKDVRGGKANLAPVIRPVVENALSDRSAPPQPRVRARPRRGGRPLQEGAGELQELADRQRRHGRAQPRPRSRDPQRRARSPVTATSATSTSSTSTFATRPRSSSTSRRPSATSSTRPS